MNIVHDYEISNYYVDFETNQISINICKETNMKKILFKNVFCHNFLNEMPYSIILDLEERPLDNFFTDNEKLLINGMDYGWPIMVDNLDNLKKEVTTSNLKYYVIRSSYGLNGFVLSESLEISSESV